MIIHASPSVNGKMAIIFHQDKNGHAVEIYKGFLEREETVKYISMYCITFFCDWLTQQLEHLGRKEVGSFARCHDFITWARKQEDVAEVCLTGLRAIYHFKIALPYDRIINEITMFFNGYKEA